MTAADIALALGDARREDPGWCACPTCGAPKNDGFAAACRNADVKEENAPVPQKLADNVSIAAAWSEINDPNDRPTPKTVIEAVWYSIAEHGLAALSEPANRSRLDTFDDDARTELQRRLAALQSLY